MRSAGQIPDKVLARRFADYLLTRGISVRLAAGPEGFTVWVYDEDHLPQVREELARFLAAPADPRYSVAREADELRARAQQAAAPAAARQIVLPPAAARVGPMATPLTLALVVFCGVVAAYTQFAPLDAPILAKLTIADIDRVDTATIRWRHLEELRSGEVWRILTPCFVHLDGLHLFFNSLGLLLFGRQIEASHGTLALAAMVLGFGAASNYAQYLVHGPQFAGMSGVVFGLFGFAALMSRFAPTAGIAVAPETALVTGLWFVVCFTGLVGPIANTAHAVGLILGVASGGLGVWWHSRR
jgi:GlpG protein